VAKLIPNYALGEKIGKMVEIEARTIDELIRMGTERYGEAFSKAIQVAAIVVNGRSVNRLQGGKTPLGKEDTVWLLLPSSGG
jgi:molybdopterin converting factor small subunit